MIRSAKSSGIIRKFDRKIRISRLHTHRHHSAPTRKQIVSTSEDTMQSYSVVAVEDRIANAERYVSSGTVKSVVQRLLPDRDGAYIHVRDSAAGGYDFCIERTSDKEGVNESKKSNGGGSRE